MCKVLVCDNENCLELIKQDIMNCFRKRVGEIILFDRRDKLEFYVERNRGKSNIVFINVMFGGGKGIEISKRIIKEQPDSQIIFVSDADNYCLDVYAVEHAYFLKKPLSQPKLRMALERAASHLELRKNKCMVIKNKQGYYKIPYNEILFFENDKRMIHVHTAEEQISYYGRFVDLLAELDNSFMKCHKSYIANIARVRKIVNNKLVFETGEEIQISKAHFNEVKEALMEYLLVT